MLYFQNNEKMKKCVEAQESHMECEKSLESPRVM